MKYRRFVKTSLQVGVGGGGGMDELLRLLASLLAGRTARFPQILRCPGQQNLQGVSKKLQDKEIEKVLYIVSILISSLEKYLCSLKIWSARSYIEWK